MTEPTGAPGKPLGGAEFFVIDSPPDGGGGAASGAAGFHLSRDALATELANLKNLRERISSQVDEARPMWSIVPPGQDPASMRNTDASNNSGNFYHGHLLKESAYLDSFIHKMAEALGTHEANDQQASTDAKQAGQGPI
ncbi:hypothetical protein OG943_43575 [Amycolatopsis sp. NBC_00345]|uniref:hypothetical protein n=1 Tax=Amycolatopsis sp. NBC_00345 TaxID=2975955 RepID=UPI002E26BB6C